MRSRHLRQVDGLAILVYSAHCAISLIVSEAILYAYNDPTQCVRACSLATVNSVEPYHKLVKTTPKPNATKNSRGELPGVLLFLPVSVWVGVGTADEVLVASAIFDWRVCVCRVSLESHSRAPELNSELLWWWWWWWRCLVRTEGSVVQRERGPMLTDARQADTKAA
jgi:hypothetical protein